MVHSHQPLGPAVLAILQLQLSAEKKVANKLLGIITHAHQSINQIIYPWGGKKMAPRTLLFGCVRWLV